MPDIASLYPPITPYASGMLGTAGPHRIYWETSGNPDGLPVLFVHGGPGSGTSPNQRRFSIRHATASFCSISVAVAAPCRTANSPTTPPRI